MGDAGDTIKEVNRKKSGPKRCVFLGFYPNHLTFSHESTYLSLLQKTLQSPSLLTTALCAGRPRQTPIMQPFWGSKQTTFMFRVTVAALSGVLGDSTV